MNRNGNSANFFSYVCNGKKIKELFASTLDRINISVRCVSSMIVVLNAKFALLFAARANKSMAGKKRPFSGYPGADISLRNNFANSGSCAKVSVPVHIYNSLVSVKMSIDAYCSGT